MARVSQPEIKTEIEINTQALYKDEGIKNNIFQIENAGWSDGILLMSKGRHIFYNSIECEYIQSIIYLYSMLLYSGENDIMMIIIIISFSPEYNNIL